MLCLLILFYKFSVISIINFSVISVLLIDLLFGVGDVGRYYTSDSALSVPESYLGVGFTSSIVIPSVDAFSIPFFL